jgi:hypothetical protein
MAGEAPSSQVVAARPDQASGRLVYAPRIVANRRQIDNRFPTLGFTLDSGGLPFLEVLLATDSALFDPANASRRTAATFYSSRQTAGGLMPSSEAVHPFLVPSAVLRSFAAANPKPRAIFYTLIAYQGADGSGPAFAQAPASLVTGAPSVAILPDFTGNTLATVLSVSVEKLVRVGGHAGTPATPSPQADAGEGEDGYGAPPPPGPAPVSPPAQQAFEAQAYVPRPDYQLAILPVMPAAAVPTSSRVSPADPLLPHPVVAPGTRNGYRTSGALAAAQGTDYGQGEEEPDYLAGDEDDRDYRSQGGSAALSGAAGYRDEADELDLHPTAFQSLDESPAAPAQLQAQPLTVADKMRIIDHVAPFESGGDYGAMNADGEFEGRFGSTHPAYQRYHVGLSYGLIQFTQDSGGLGQLVGMMRDRDPEAFAHIFGPDTGELIRVANAAGPASSTSPSGRSARVQPVAGADLWREPWVSRFRAAAENDQFKAAQRELAARGYVDPMLKFAGWLGLDTERALTMVVDRAVQMGVGGAQRWIISAVGPVGAEAVRHQALAAVGQPDLRSFQAATPGLTVDGEWGPESHAALVAALRRLGPASPVPVPTTEQMIEAMVRRAAPEAWHPRLDTLRSADMPTVHYQL